MLGLAYCISRRICVNSSSKKKLLAEDMDSDNGKENCFSAVLEDSVKAIGMSHVNCPYSFSLLKYNSFRLKFIIVLRNINLCVVYKAWI